MTNEEHFTLVGILEGDPWMVRKRLQEFMKTVKVVEVPVPPENSTTGLVEPQKTLLNGKPLPKYPEYTGEPTI